MSKSINTYNLSEAETLLGFSDIDKWEINKEVKYLKALIELRRKRKEKGLTQTTLAERSGIPRPMISQIESGKRNVTISTLSKLARAMGQDIGIRFK